LVGCAYKGKEQKGQKECAMQLRWEGQIEVCHESFCNTAYTIYNTDAKLKAQEIQE